MTSPAQTAPTPEKIMRYAWGYAPPLILEAAVRTRIFDVLNEGPRTAAETSAATGASERGLSSIMNALVGLEFLTRDDNGRYALTPESATYLVSSKPAYFGGFLAHISRQLIPDWLDLTDVVETGKPVASVNRRSQGAAFFEQFVAGLFAMNYGSAVAAADALGVAAAAAPVKVLDLAAGSGVFGIAIAQQSPRVTVTAVDWPNVLEITRKTAAQCGVADRVSYVAGDLDSADFGTGYNVATLGHILHSEGEARGRSLLRKTYAALAPGGTIVIAEFLVNADRRGPLSGLLFDVNMLVHTDVGATYSFEEIRGWLEECGFRDARLVDSPGPSPLIFATR
ncbi:MAG TPA: methyltransferase [Bryobacteraceae bacterium]|jgi:ubiquinone/menaquinone biosynthesis C-methylase UbiE|nr:methyltransferase [Bryobacteraceae bacterium]